MNLTTRRLVIRSLQPADVEALARLWTDPGVTRFMGGPREYDDVLATLREDAVLAKPPKLDLWPVLERETGRIVGHCGLLEKEIEGQEEVELIYLIAGDAWGRGYASEAAATIRDFAQSTLGLRRLVALIDPGNTASERVALKVGMSFERDVTRPGGKTMKLYALDLGAPASGLTT